MDMTLFKGKKIIVYGAGSIGQIAIIALRGILEKFEEQIIGCAVTTANHNPKFLEEVPVRTLDYYVDCGEDVLYLIAVKEMYKEQVITELSARGISSYAYFDYEKYIELLEEMWKKQNEKRYNDFKKNVDTTLLSKEEYIAFLSRQLKKGVLDFEINLADHCNLNCQCCNHFSPIADKVFLDCKQLDKDLQRLKQLLHNRIGKIMLLGGEPLLHPQINDILSICRGHLPATNLNIVTNGLLIPKMKKEFWDLMRNLQICLTVTKYPIHFDYEYCEMLAEKNGISISYGYLPETIKTTYHLPIKDSPQFNPYQMYAKCEHANRCVVLRKGRLYTCPLAANVHHYNKYFGKKIPEGTDVSIDLYNVDEWIIMEEFLKHPNKMCSYCDIYHYTYDIPWTTSKRDVREWT